MQYAIKKSTTALLLLLISLFALGTAYAQVTERVKVADPYLEMRTGPGRGFPVHHVAARHEFVIIELRATDWFKVRTVSDTGNDKTGWVHRRQLEGTPSATPRSTTTWRGACRSAPPTAASAASRCRSSG